MVNNYGLPHHSGTGSLSRTENAVNALVDEHSNWHPRVPPSCWPNVQRRAPTPSNSVLCPFLIRAPTEAGLRHGNHAPISPTVKASQRDSRPIAPVPEPGVVRFADKLPGARSGPSRQLLAEHTHVRGRNTTLPSAASNGPFHVVGGQSTKQSPKSPKNAMELGVANASRNK